jgi:spermidine synthase
LGAGFFLIPSLGLKSIFLGLGLSIVLLSILLMPKKEYFLLGVVPILLLAAVPFNPQGIIYETDTAYYHVRVFQTSEARYLLLDYDSHSGEYLNSTEPVFKYTQILSKTQDLRSHSERILFVGLGSGSLPKHFLGKGNCSIDVVEIDPEIIRIAREWFGFPEGDPRMHVYNEDARRFLSDSGEKYDLIILDAYSSRSSVPYHMMTAEFFNETSKRLSEDGVLAFNLISPPREGLAPHTRASLSAYFGNIWTYCTRNQTSETQNIVLIAWNDHEGEKWSPPESLAGYGACYRGIEAEEPFTDDWAPTEYILAKYI